MDPGYNEINRRQDRIRMRRCCTSRSRSLRPNIFAVANGTDKIALLPLRAHAPRAISTAKAKELGCNKIALGHHFSDVVETTVMGMFYGAQLQAMPPKLHSTNFAGHGADPPASTACMRTTSFAWKNYQRAGIHPMCLPLHRELHDVRRAAAAAPSGRRSRRCSRRLKQ